MKTIMNNEQNLGQEPAFSGIEKTSSNPQEGILSTLIYKPGMSKRFYACIKLGVPDSGEEWLDEMIRRKNRRDVASAALQGILSCEYSQQIPDEAIVRVAFNMANEFQKQETQIIKKEG